jgi:CheY-like chemotaxis protein/anti-sigma regulatory factor (Ser/Thr protein kinase)
VKASQKYHVLVVDDEPAICRILVDLFHSEGYSARSAANGAEALAAIEKNVPHVIVSDIRMPVMDGIELFGIISERYPLIKHILMTSYNVDEYLSLIRRHNIGNILVKGSDFNLREVSAYVRTILTGEIFGLERFFPAESLRRVVIDSYAKSAEVCSRIAHKCKDSTGLYLQMAIDELVANAVFHGVLRMTGLPRESWRGESRLGADNAITVTWAVDGEKIGVSVEDPKGNLKKVDALRWLDQQDTSGREHEEHGRGLYLVRRLIDRFIINIDPGRRTECIVIQYFNQDHLNNFKPLLIHEI